MDLLESRRLLAGGSGIGGGPGGPGGGDIKYQISLSINPDHAARDEEGPLAQREVTFRVNRGQWAINEDMTFGVQVVTDQYVTDPKLRAVAPQDYTTPPTSITVDAGHEVGEFTVVVKNDAIAEGKVGDLSPKETFVLALVPRETATYKVTDGPVSVDIFDGSRYYYSDWKKRLGPDSLTTGNTAVATSDPVIQAHGGGGAIGGGPPTSFIKTVEHLYYFDVSAVVAAQKSGEWMNDVDGDGKDDNDVSLNVTNYRGSDHSFTFSLGVDRKPVEVTLFQYTYSTSNQTAVGQTFEAGASDNQKVRLVVLARTRHYEKRVDTYTQISDGLGGYDPNGWGEPTTTYEAVGTGSEFPEMQKAVFEINRYWLDPDNTLVPSLFTQSKENEKPEDKFWTGEIPSNDPNR